MSFVKTRRDDPASPLAPSTAWESDCHDFVGKATVSEAFAVDGRDDDHDAVWDAPIDGDAFWTSPDGYAIHLVDDPDWSPETLLLLDPRGEACGFYSGGEAWVDPGHRGQGLGSEMVLAMAEAMGRRPVPGGEAGMGFSRAGLEAHRMAWVAAVERALDAGLPVSSGRVAAAGGIRDSRPLPTASPSP